MPWEMLSDGMRKSISKRGFGSPTSIQEDGMQQILSGNNVLLMAPTGLGKTEAALLPVFDLWVRVGARPISILYITPMRSLNRDLHKRILWWSKELDMEASVRHGDTSVYERGMQAENPPDMLISTPETLQSLLTGSRMRAHLSNIRWIVIDEVHEIVASKRGVQLSVALERLKELIRSASNPEPQIVALSATVGSPEGVAQYITSGKGCKIVDAMHIRRLGISVESPAPGREDYRLAPEVFMTPQTAARVRRIQRLISGRDSVLVFTNTRESAEVISSRLRAFDSSLRLDTHHSSLSKDLRVKAEEGFKSGEIKSLVCTSSLELGIDIGSIDFIVQFMSPRQVSKLLQRIGRSGHTASGLSEGVIISSDPDDCFEAAAIARLALDGRIEASRLYGKSLDVLMHQIVGLSLEEYGMPAEKAFAIIKKAWPFRGLSGDEFQSACLLLQKLGLIWVDSRSESGKPELRRRRKSWDYYFSNMSTIPDTRSYKVLDVVSNQLIGSLDAEFVALHGSPGLGFIVRGRAWKILEIYNGRVMVEPMAGVEAAIPAWAGELMPVPRDVAQLVGRMRGEIAGMLGAGSGRREAEEYLKRSYPVSGETAKVMVSAIEKQARSSLPDDRTILIEHAPAGGLNNIVINSCFGSLINDTLGRALADMLAARFGSVGLQADPYRIVLKMHAGTARDVLEALGGLKAEHIKAVLDASLPNTDLFQWRFLHVARRAGVISRDADFGKFYLRRVIDAYRGSPVFAETLHELYEEKLDVNGAEELLKAIGEGSVKVVLSQGLSHISELGVMPRYEVMSQDRPEAEIFRVFKERLMKTKIRLVCMQCGSAVTYIAEDVPKDVRCVGCKAKLVGAIHPDDMDSELLVNRRIKGRSMSREEDEALERMADCAALVAGAGRDAVIALAGRGVGPRAAARILRRPGRGDDFLREILREEQLYARNKRFWR